MLGSGAKSGLTDCTAHDVLSVNDTYFIVVINTVLFTLLSYHSKYFTIGRHFIAEQVMKDDNRKTKWEYSKGGITG